MVRVSAGPVDELPRDGCISAGAGAAVVARVGDEVVAFENRCLHQESPLAGGYLKEGVLTCPLHFWRYRLPGGVHVGSDETLVAYRVEIIDGEIFVDVPDPLPPMSMREKLLAHAEEWNREHA